MNPPLHRSSFLRALMVAWALLALASAALAASFVGEVTLNIGASQLERAGESGAVSKGYGILPGDVIRTTASGHVHIRFVDGARVSVRPDSVLHVVEYRYDPADPATSLIKFHLETGTVRGISGLAAQSARDKFRLNTPLVAIGIKGTDFVTQASAQSAVVLVNQGAIVLAPLDANCRADAFGPCGTSRSRELGANTSGLALVYRQSTTDPVFQPINSLKGMERISPGSPHERLGSGPATVVTDATSAERATNTAVAESKTIDRVVGKNLEYFPILQPDSPKSAAVVASPPEVAPPPPPPPPPSLLTWGRWAGSSVPGDNLTVPFADALSGGRVTVGDGYYFLFRNENVANLLSSASSVVDFRLQQGAASYLDSTRTVSAATVDGGSLSIDFGRNTFSTRLAVTAASIGTQAVAATGTVERPSGFLRGSGQDVRVTGAVSLDVSQAGYFFTKAVGNGTLSGATLWGR
ncbi:MAG: FecR family protein [Accumulibacter sp.]|uniref:FecR family protein n=1 Tax=Accumulibacter sp. TaxID=2053492 RepID=UPI002FC3D271